MCLSPEVDLVAGIGISVVALDAIRHARDGRTLPVALLPAVFAVHSFSSALVWWGMRGDVPAVVGDAAVWLYLFVAFVVLPVYVPVSILLLEPPGWRRNGLLLLTGAGAVAGADFLSGLLAGRGSVVPCEAYLHFSIVDSLLYTPGLYVAATCGAMLLSGHRPLVWWGVLNAAAVTILTLTTRAGYASLWCAWAALTSVFVAWLMRELARAHDAGQPPPWRAPPARAAQPLLHR